MAVNPYTNIGTMPFQQQPATGGGGGGVLSPQALGWGSQQDFLQALLGGNTGMNPQMDSILQQLGISGQHGAFTNTASDIRDTGPIAGMGGYTNATDISAQLQKVLGPGGGFQVGTTSDPAQNFLQAVTGGGQVAGQAGYDPRIKHDYGFDAALIGLAAMGGAAFAGAGAGAAGGAEAGAGEAAVATPVAAGSVTATDLGTLGAGAAGGTATAAGVGAGGAADVGAGALSTNLSMPGFSGSIGPGGAGTLAGDAGGAVASGGPSMSNIFQGANLGSKVLGGGGGDGKGGGMDWTSLLGQGLTSWMGYQQGQQMQRAGQAADPFAPYRAGFAQQLQQLMADPSSVTKLPGYQANMAAGEQALTRNLASQGLTGSGTAAEAITKFGAEYEQQAFQQQLLNLMGLSGANINNADLTLKALASGMGAKSGAANSLLGAFGGMGGGDWLSGLMGDAGSWLGDNSFLGDLGSGSSWFGDLLGI